MKIIILEATAEELRANRRIADSICDALEVALDTAVGIYATAGKLMEGDEDDS